MISNYPFDERVARLLDRLSQASSRRGFLSRAGSLVIRGLGVSLIRVLPVGLIVATAEATTPCTDWRFCGIYAIPCDRCDGGTLTSCPPNTDEGGQWSCCCHDSSGTGYVVDYVDCCNPDRMHHAHCTIDWCMNGPPEQAWCTDNPLKPYSCTIIRQHSAGCGQCLTCPCGSG